jgi:hypothetical protein
MYVGFSVSREGQMGQEWNQTNRRMYIFHVSKNGNHELGTRFFFVRVKERLQK